MLESLAVRALRSGKAAPAFQTVTENSHQFVLFLADVRFLVVWKTVLETRTRNSTSCLKKGLTFNLDIPAEVQARAARRSRDDCLLMASGGQLDPARCVKCNAPSDREVVSFDNYLVTGRLTAGVDNSY